MMNSGEKRALLPQCELNPFFYKRLPRLEELRSGETNHLELLERVFNNLEREGISLDSADEEVFCKEILCDLHCDVREFPGIAMACYWLWDRALRQEELGVLPDPSFADIYAMLCAIQRNNFRIILEENIWGNTCERENSELYQLLEKAAFPPEYFRSTQEYWTAIKEADEVLERARMWVTTHLKLE